MCVCVRVPSIPTLHAGNRLNWGTRLLYYSESAKYRVQHALAEIASSPGHSNIFNVILAENWRMRL